MSVFSGCKLILAVNSYVHWIFFLVGIQTLGKNVLVAGRSKNVGMPIAMLLHTDGKHERPGGEKIKQKHVHFG